MAWINREGEALEEGIPKPSFEIDSLQQVLEIVNAD